jgi:hypothetical protein
MPGGVTAGTVVRDAGLLLQFAEDGDGLDAGLFSQGIKLGHLVRVSTLGAGGSVDLPQDSLVSPGSTSDRGCWGFGQRIDARRERARQSRPRRVGELAEHLLLHGVD